MADKQVVTRFKHGDLTKFEPSKTKIKIGGIKAAIAHAAKLQDPAFFEDAVRAYVDEQQRFVRWWDSHVSPGEHEGRPPKEPVAIRTQVLRAADAEEQTGISKWQVSRWRLQLKDPAAYTRSLCVKLWRLPWARRDREQMHAEDEERVRSLVPREGRFRTLVIDPPWDYDWLSLAGRAKPGYATMTHEQLITLDVQQWADDSCALYCWTTNNFITRAVALVEAWGFKHKTVLTWVKEQWGLGSYFRNQTEHVLFATLGEVRTRRDDISTVFYGESGEHSEKPEEFYKIVRASSHEPYGEAFQRAERADFVNLFVEQP